MFAQSRVLTIACLLMSGRVNITSLLAKAGSRVWFSFGVRAWTEVEIWCVEGMHRLKLISSEKYSGFKGLIDHRKL